eukprot:GHVP01065679.1.p1 GENE.GHVP01065679.1~~GHVP01065679.1.p1  ORF type:complete len:507 (+),score=86.67 GHVP01065679.1:4654-6174(+)
MEDKADEECKNTEVMTPFCPISNGFFVKKQLLSKLTIYSQLPLIMMNKVNRYKPIKSINNRVSSEASFEENYVINDIKIEGKARGVLLSNDGRSFLSYSTKSLYVHKKENSYAPKRICTTRKEIKMCIVRKDFRLAIIIEGDSRMILCGIELEKELRSMNIKDKEITSCVFVSDSSTFLVGLSDGTIEEVDPAVEETKKTNMKHEGAVRGLIEFNKETREFISYGDDFLISLWDMDKGKRRMVVNTEEPVTKVLVIDDKIYSSSYSDINCHSIDGKFLWQEKRGIGIKDFNITQNFIVTLSVDKKVRFYDRETQKLKGSLEKNIRLYKVDANDTGETIVIGMKGSIIIMENKAEPQSLSTNSNLVQIGKPQERDGKLEMMLKKFKYTEAFEYIFSKNDDNETLHFTKELDRLGVLQRTVEQTEIKLEDLINFLDSSRRTKKYFGDWIELFRSVVKRIENTGKCSDLYLVQKLLVSIRKKRESLVEMDRLKGMLKTIVLFTDKTSSE